MNRRALLAGLFTAPLTAIPMTVSKKAAVDKVFDLARFRSLDSGSARLGLWGSSVTRLNPGFTYEFPTGVPALLKWPGA